MSEPEITILCDHCGESVEWDWQGSEESGDANITVHPCINCIFEAQEGGE